MARGQEHYVVAARGPAAEPEGAGEYGHLHDEEAKPALSDRLRDAAATVGDKVRALTAASRACKGVSLVQWVRQTARRRPCRLGPGSASFGQQCSAVHVALDC